MNVMAEVSTAFVYPGLCENMVSGQSSPGILVLSRSLQLQYVNRRALELIRNIGQAITDSGLIILPTPLLDLRDQIQESLDARIEANIWEPFEMSRVVSQRGQRLLLRGFGHPNEVANRDSRIIIVFEEIGSAEHDRNQQIRARMTGPELQPAGARFLANS
jgi:hypothetical protein